MDRSNNIGQPLTWFDEARARGATGGDVMVLREIAVLFLDDVPQRIRDLHEALAAKDTERLARQAHSIRGSAVTFGSEATAQAALRLEMIAMHRQAEALPAMVVQLEYALGKLIAALQDFLNKTSVFPTVPGTGPKSGA